MTITRQIVVDEEAEKLKIPLDLSEWCDKRLLLAWIQEEVETLDWSKPDLVAYLDRHPAFQPKTMLGLLSFAYATSVFESEEIVRQCYADEFFRSLSPKPAPSALELGRFRRENRGLLKWLLTHLLRRAFKEKFAMGERLLPAGLRQYLVETANARLDIARHVDRAAHGA